MSKIILRWNIGENRAYRLRSQAFEMLDYSMKFSKVFMENLNKHVEYYLCINNLVDDSLKKVKKISKKNEIQIIDVSEDLPVNLRIENVKNSWWKYAIPRIDELAYEIIIDNDVILWTAPPTLQKAIKENILIALQDGVGKFYGDFLKEVCRLDDKLELNAGLFGCPPGFKIDLSTIAHLQFKDNFFSEQGYTAYNYANYNGKKELIPLYEVQQLNANRISALELSQDYCGGHFCGCSNDVENFWYKIYAVSIKNKYMEYKK